MSKEYIVCDRWYGFSFFFSLSRLNSIVSAENCIHGKNLHCKQIVVFVEIEFDLILPNDQNIVGLYYRKRGMAKSKEANRRRTSIN